jgi:hypothetical protein
MFAPDGLFAMGNKITPLAARNTPNHQHPTFEKTPLKQVLMGIILFSKNNKTITNCPYSIYDRTVTVLCKYHELIVKVS